MKMVKEDITAAFSKDIFFNFVGFEDNEKVLEAEVLKKFSSPQKVLINFIIFIIVSIIIIIFM